MIDPSIPLQIQPPKIDDPLAVYGKVLNIQNAQQQQQMGAQKIQSNAMELKQQQQNMDAENALNTALKAHTSIGDDGNIRIDHAGVTKDLVNQGFSQQALKFDTGRAEAIKKALDAEKDRVEVVGKKNEQLANIAGNVGKLDQAETDPIKKQQNIAAWNGRAQTALGQAIDQGLVNPQAIPQLKAAVAQGWSPELEQQLDAFAGAATTNVQRHTILHQDLTGLQAKLTGEATVSHLNAETDKVKGESSEKARNDAATMLAGSTNAASYDAKKATLDPKIAAQLPDSKELNWASPADAQKQILRAGMSPAQVAEDERGKKLGDNTLLELRSKGKTTGNASIDALSPKEAGSSLQRLKPPPTNVSITNLSPAALDQAAQSYATTGQLPTLGFGKEAAGMRAKIMERAAELNPTNDLAAAKTDYAANQQAIKDVTKNRSRVLTSEGTAAKNLSLVTDLSKKVSRTGSPLVNKYLLSLKGKVAGDDETQMLNNAVETVANEYANVVTAGSSGGAATTDASRAHARDMIHSAMGDGTLQKVAVLMRKEMSNRHSAFDEQLADLRSGRSKTGAAGTGAAAASTTQAPAGGATKRYNPATGQIETVK